MSSVFGLTCGFAEDRLVSLDGVGRLDEVEEALHLTLEQRGDP